MTPPALHTHTLTPPLTHGLVLGLGGLVVPMYMNNYKLQDVLYFAFNYKNNFISLNIVSNDILLT